MEFLTVDLIKKEPVLLLRQKAPGSTAKEFKSKLIKTKIKFNI